jgi:hypothetical protein
MGATKKPRKRYREAGRVICIDPLYRLQPATKEQRIAILARFGSSIEQLARGQMPSMAEWRELADMCNTLETLILHMHELDAQHLPDVTAAMLALLRAANRNQTHGKPALDGPGLEALRDCYSMYCQCSEELTEATMHRAKVLTEQRLQRERRNPSPGSIVIAP